MVANQDDSGDEHSKKDYTSSESKKRDITTPHTPQIPFTPNTQGYSFSPTDTRHVKQTIILPVPTSNYDSIYNYNSPQHGSQYREEVTKAMFEHEKSNREYLFSTEGSRDKVIMPVPSNEPVGKTAGEWDEDVIIPESSEGTESTETRLWEQPHREARLGTQKLILPVHDSSAKDEQVADQLEHEHHNSPEMNAAAQAKSETVGVTSSEIEKPLVTGPLQSETDTKKQPMEFKSMMGEQSNLKESVENTPVTQFLYKKEYTSFEEPAGYEIKDLDAYIEDFADDNSPSHSSMEKSQMKTEQVKPLESLDKKEKGKADLADKTSPIYSNQPQEILAAEKSNAKTEKTKLLEDFADEATLMYSKAPQKISAADKGHVYAEKAEPLESLDKKEKGKADLADKASLIYSKQPQEISAADKSNVKTEKTKLLEDFADEATLVYSKEPQKISAADKGHVYAEKAEPLESLDKKEKGKADLADKASLIYSKQPQEISAADKSNVKTEKTKLLEDFADEATLVYSKEPQKISAVDKGHVYAEKAEPLKSLDKKEKGKADLADKTSLIYSKQPQEISAADKSNVKTEKTKLLEDFADEATLVYSKKPQKISAVDKGHVYAEKAKPLESLDKKEKGKAYAEKPVKTETQDFDTYIKDFVDDDFLIHSKQPYKISEADKSHVKTEKIKPPESGEKKEKGKAYSEITDKQFKSAEKPEKSKIKDLDAYIKDFAEEASLIHSKHPHKISATDKNRVIKIVKVKPRESWEEKEKEKAYGEITKKQYKTAEKPAKSDEASFIHSKQPHKISAMDKSHVQTEKIKPLESLENKEKGKADNLTESAKKEKTSLARQSSIQKDTSVKYEVSEGKRDSEIQRKILTNNIKVKESNQGEPKSKISDIKRIYRDEPSFETEKQERMTDDNVSAIEKYLQQEISKVSPEKVRRDKTGPMKVGEKAKTDANTEAEVKTMPSKHYTEQKVYKWQEILQNEDDRLPYTKSDTTDMTKKRQEIKKAKDELKAIKEGSVRERQKIPYQEDSPPKETKASPPKEVKGSPPLERKGYPAKETKGSPPKETKASPYKVTKRSPPIVWHPPKETKGSPPKETKGFPPKDTSPRGAAKPDKHSSFDKYSSGKNDPKMHSSFYKYTSGTNESDKQTPVDKYYTRQNEPNKHSAMHPQKPDDINLTVPVSHFTVTDKKDTKFGSHKSQTIIQQNEAKNQSSKTITGQTPNLPTESTTRQGVTSQSITLLDSPPRYLVKDIKESEVTKSLGGKLQPGITQNTLWPVHRLSSVNAKYLGKQATPWGDAGTFFPWVTYAAQKKSYQSYLLTEQSRPNNQGNGPGSGPGSGYGPGSGSQIWQFLGRQYGVFKDNFNNHTLHGRANVAKATLLAVGVFALWQMLKPKKSQLTFQRCSECGAIAPLEKRH